MQNPAKKLCKFVLASLPHVCGGISVDEIMRRGPLLSLSFYLTLTYVPLPFSCAKKAHFPFFRDLLRGIFEKKPKKVPRRLRRRETSFDVVVQGDEWDLPPPREKGPVVIVSQLALCRRRVRGAAAVSTYCTLVCCVAGRVQTLSIKKMVFLEAPSRTTTARAAVTQTPFFFSPVRVQRTPWGGRWVRGNRSREM